MKFANEKCVEDHIRELIAQHITASNPYIFAFENQTISDVVICRNCSPQAIYFIEVKCFQLSNGRLGLGSQKGGGIQPEILKKRPAYLESNLRWLICRDDKDDRYWLVTSETLCSHISGGHIGNKQNNIRLSLFENVPSLSKDQLLNEMKIWLEHTIETYRLP